MRNFSLDTTIKKGPNIFWKGDDLRKGRESGASAYSSEAWNPHKKKRPKGRFFHSIR
jgi:hypothetical protein